MLVRSTLHHALAKDDLLIPPKMCPWFVILIYVCGVYVCVYIYIYIQYIMLRVFMLVTAVGN